MPSKKDDKIKEALQEIKTTAILPAKKEAKMDSLLAKKYLQVAKYSNQKQKRVEINFWPKFRKFIGKVPFSDDLLAAYFCAFDEKTPKKVRGVLLAALAYFILPVDFVPDFILGLGFTDDATVLMTAFGLVSQYVKPKHVKKAKEALDIELAEHDGKED